MPTATAMELNFGPPKDSADSAPWSVSQVNARAKQLIERHFGRIAIAGEISNLRHDRSGHRYFTLKDAGGVLSAALFRQRSGRLTFEPKDGQQVVATGTLTIYGPQGRYQLMVEGLVEAGAGALQAAFERTKNKLQAEGLFAQERKRPLPYLPRRIAVITSPHGAVWRDIVHVAQRRFSRAPLLLLPCRVQGPECVPEVVAALRLAACQARARNIDVIIVARGGGSLEDLFGFNDEQVARAIVASPVPVVSAIGHETDFTIADFVADMRAPTPSAAAEMVVPQRLALATHLSSLVARLSQAAARDVRHERQRLRAVVNALPDARQLLMSAQQALALAESRMTTALQRRLGWLRSKVLNHERRLFRQHPRAQLGRQAVVQAQLQGRLSALSQQHLARARNKLSVPAAALAPALTRLLHRRRQKLLALEGRAHALSPTEVLGRGYAIVMAPGGKVVRRPEDTAVGDSLQLRLSGGTLTAVAQGRADLTD